MEFHIDLVGRRRLPEQFYRRIRAGIHDGQSLPADPLPSSRELADRLTVSRNTVTAAYDRLGAEGPIDARPGVGAFVSSRPTAVRPSNRVAKAAPRPPPWVTLPEPRDLSAAVAEFDFRSGIPSRSHFPTPPGVRSSPASCASPPRPGGMYAEPAGSPTLRAATPGTWRCPASGLGPRTCS